MRKKEIYKIAHEHLRVERDRKIRQQHKLAQCKRIDAGMLIFHLVTYRAVPSPKLLPKFEGPYRVLLVRNNKALCKCLAPPLSPDFTSIPLSWPPDIIRTNLIDRTLVTLTSILIVMHS